MKPVNVTAVTAAVAGATLTALLVAGCGGQPSGAHQGTVAACADYGVRAIEQHLTVTRKPAACQGLSKAQVNQAVGRAIYLVAGGRRKAAWRHAAMLAGARLGYLISPPQHTVSSLPRGSAIPGSGGPARRGSDAALSLAALGAWILAAGSGFYLLGVWISGRGIRRLRTGAGFPPAGIFGHFGLATTGLLAWIGYLATGATALAWIAVGLLLPVAGFGVALLTLGRSGRSGPASARRQMPVLVIVGHGLIAMTTVLLVVLAALGASGN